MAELNIDKAKVSDLDTQFGEGTRNFYFVDPQTTDAPKGQKPFRWMNDKYAQYLGYYKTIPELRESIDAKARWTIGKGFRADPTTTLILMNVRGIGGESFNSVLENQNRVKDIGGDSFAEIIPNDEGVLINLKPIDPATMVIIANKAGLITGYEQINRETKKTIHEFEPNEIFHLMRNRVADEIHGVSMIEALENIILYRNKAMADWDRVMHRNVDPLWLVKLDTDNETKISGIKSKLDEARGKGEIIYIPMGTVEMEQITIAPNSNLNPLPWIESLNSYFSQATGVPGIVMGNSKSLTEASGKMEYLVFEQHVKEEQLYIEEQVLAQLNLVIKLTFPASLMNELLSSAPEEEEPEIRTGEQAAEPRETTAGLEGNK